jgi:hypothetical protein
MQNNQLTEFDDAPNVVGDDYSFEAEMTFCRRNGDEVQTGAVLIGERGERLDDILPAMRNYLHQMGYTFVVELIAVKRNGDEVSSGR